MRERRSDDWVVDLNDRHRLEDAVTAAIEANSKLTLVERRTESFEKLDFVVATKRVARAEVELKAKWRHCWTWRKFRPEVPEHDLFILDERALRHILGFGPDSHLMILDWPNRRWVLFDVAQLALAPKERISRPLSGKRTTMKAKVLLDLQDGYPAGPKASTAVTTLAQRIDQTNRSWSQLEAWPNPVPSPSSH